MSRADAAQLLQQQVDRQADRLLERPARNCKETFIHDALWGTIRLDAHETALLNTPLLQRLRRVRQLGSAHLIFPCAQHTRFEHSLGVLHLTAQLCAALRRQHPDRISDEQVANLRMAALCHDLGHGPFSHYSEKFFATLEPIPELLGESHGAAELLSAMIVRSGPFAAFAAELTAAYGCRLDCRFIAAAITGELPAAQAYLGQIVHGPFDADKLDYLCRDGMFCGVPIRLDTDRIFRQLEIAEDQEGRVQLAGKSGGAAALMQIIQHKHHMFAAVYNHPVARSFNAMLGIALKLAYRKLAPVDGRTIAGPADFLTLDDELLLAPGSVSNSRAAQLLGDLRRRNMYKVAAWVAGGGRLAEQARTELAGNADKYAAAIAKAAAVPESAVALDICARPSNAEARDMLMRRHGELVTLGEIMALDDRAVPLHNFLERHLVLCPAIHLASITASAKQVLGPVSGLSLIQADG